MTELNPPPRLLMGPGPITADPRVLNAMSEAAGRPVRPVDDRRDDRHDVALPPGVPHRQRADLPGRRHVACRHRGGARVPARAGRPRAGAGVRSLRPPAQGDRRSAAQAEVHTIEVPWGEVFTPEAVEAAVRQVRPKLLALVQGDTSTTMCQPLADIGEIARRHDVLVYCDATASIGGNEFETDRWGLDVATAGLQKCLGGPSGSAPITISPRAADLINARKHVEAGIRDESDADSGGAHRQQLLRPRADHGLLGTSAAQPPHRGHVDAVRRPRVRAAARRRGSRCGDRPARAARPGDAGRRPGPRPQRVRGRRAQDEQRGRGRDPRRCRRRPGARRAPGRTWHRDRHVVRPAARPGLADRHDGPTTPARRPCSRRSTPSRRCSVGAAASRPADEVYA